MNTNAIAWLTGYFLVLAWSAWQPHDTFTWALEVAPALIGLAALAITRKSFPLTPLCYILILLHCWILMVGGHYTYAEVPLFDTLRDWLGQSRNNYDKLGHFAQGFVPAIICREIILRKRWMHPMWVAQFFTVCFCLAFSAFYELIEWFVAELSGDDATAFLGTQGYVWDTQSDMAFALLGALTALASLSRLHNRQIQALQAPHQGHHA